MTYDKQLLQEAEQAGLKFDTVILSPQNEMIFIRTVNGERIESHLNEIPLLVDDALDKVANEIVVLYERTKKVNEDYSGPPSEALPERSEVVIDIQIQYALAQKRLAALKNFYATIENLITAWNTQRFVIQDESDPQHDSSSPSAENENPTEDAKNYDTIPSGLYQNSQAELKNAITLIKKLKKRINYTKRPSKEIFEHLVDETRKKNGTINYSALAKRTGQTDKTIKSWCRDYGIK